MIIVYSICIDLIATSPADPEYKLMSITIVPDPVWGTSVLNAFAIEDEEPSVALTEPNSVPVYVHS